MDSTLGTDATGSSLEHLVTAYYEALDRGVVVNRQAWLGEHPEYSGELSRFLADHDLLNGLVAPLKEAIGTTTVDGPGEPSAPPGSFRPQTIGDYELIRRLGRGAMGDVYEARQVRLNRTVALKMIRAGLLATEEEVQRFRNEAEAVALLDHPRIVTIHDVGEDQGLHYFSMKLIRGGSLADRIEAFRADPRAAASLMIEVARPSSTRTSGASCTAI